MPKKLIVGYSKQSIAENLKELDSSPTQRSREQKLAIVLGIARDAAAKAGKPEKGPKPQKKRRKKS